MSVHLREGISSGQRKFSDWESAVLWTCAEIQQPQIRSHRDSGVVSGASTKGWGRIWVRCSSVEALAFVLWFFTRSYNLYKDEHLDRLQQCSAMLQRQVNLLVFKNAPHAYEMTHKKRKKTRSAAGTVQQRSLQMHFTCPTNQSS